MKQEPAFNFLHQLQRGKGNAELVTDQREAESAFKGLLQQLEQIDEKLLKSIEEGAIDTGAALPMAVKSAGRWIGVGVGLGVALGTGLGLGALALAFAGKEYKDVGKDGLDAVKDEVKEVGAAIRDLSGKHLEGLTRVGGGARVLALACLLFTGARYLR
ncbi:hypothetical protein KFL_000750135 [Klebsormidium nitens]|uniref:Uncharacterized protein n=1 Tax=Klebsormidium nitens TaxID=105231 RepID=A0A0U9HJP8_KLENI|nr:hypothetical protein KFL_000750135 [Klebsormidium nitens]|eukprot:GAQ81245.1 hypothetical protein KFL_000750135 [Klebsormidium nitens]